MTEPESPAERRLTHLVRELGTTSPQPPPDLASRVVRTARCRRARSTSSAVKRELTAGVWLPTSRNSSTARDSAGSREGSVGSLIPAAPSRRCWRAASR